MLSNRMAFALLAVACLAAAAGGGYLATRQNVAPTPVGAVAAIAPAATPAAKPVQETEAVVGTPEVKPTLPAEAPAPAAKRSEPIAKPVIRTVNGSDASPRGRPKSACTAGSATVNDHMPTPPMVLMTTQIASRTQE